jgi:hypothetical protein
VSRSRSCAPCSRRTPWCTSWIRSAGGQQTAQIFDTENGFGGAPTTDIMPGKSVTFPVAFTDAAPGEVVVQIQAPNGDKIYFTRQR